MEWATNTVFIDVHHHSHECFGIFMSMETWQTPLSVCEGKWKRQSPSSQAFKLEDIYVHINLNTFEKVLGKAVWLQSYNFKKLVWQAALFHRAVSSQKMKKKKKQQGPLLSVKRSEKAYSTWYSQAVSHPSTNQARPCLASEIRRDRACSQWYGRKRNLQPRVGYFKS